MKKIEKILIGTHNPGKYREISQLLPKKIVKISPKKLNIRSPKETGKTFKANAELKAKYFSKNSHLPCISDDSGLVIQSLQNKPGVHSSRFAKKNGGFKSAMKKIISLMKNKKNRSASFFCALTFIINNKKYSVIGRVDGQISHKILGTNGFGYDSIFLPRGYKITFGQMKNNKKMKIDHRQKAFIKLRKKINIL
tara:strand:+ start:201 stop:785 length:585 start_codon:yes stop_codon:yes gene_type:complete